MCGYQNKGAIMINQKAIATCSLGALIITVKIECIHQSPVLGEANGNTVPNNYFL